MCFLRRTHNNKAVNSGRINLKPGSSYEIQWQTSNKRVCICNIVILVRRPLHYAFVCLLQHLSSSDEFPRSANLLICAMQQHALPTENFIYMQEKETVIIVGYKWINLFILNWDSKIPKMQSYREFKLRDDTEN